ncbi:hypothetical protein QWY81_17760 [Polaribacter undariae]|uniref:Uncharacterized protein n=1 Tax=Polaribacter sejongensis TaxID=985043 RepID=A0AAJ1R0P9_9FLAO|nr:hypothetical protein [Polaribacter undariae]MDN3621318.1 hypothetical protein [Polaribacter undariae]UWD31860.1 hypothetical protein NQP51_17225 [Polaribacter undariae]
MSSCKHPPDKQTLVVVSAVLGCETTRVQCTNCNQFLTEPKTDC